ncbi:MAG: SARP family transcriptional regulator, partial [Actinobacteria bacterium]|nr:SARP family transcriptional regulator [Actinomycetota bacterium]
RHLKSAAGAVLREAAMFKLAAGDSAAAADLALHLVSLDPLNEASQALLIRAYVACGDRGSAMGQLQACRELFRRELGLEPGSLVVSAVDEFPVSRDSASVRGESSVRALLEAGEAAIRAGAFEHGVRSLQAAAADAAGGGNLALEARSRYVLGSTLMHCGRNRYEEAALTMHLVASLAERLGDQILQASAYRELAWAELLAARYVRVETLLDQAAILAGDDAVEQAAILFVRGMALTETGKYDASITHLRASVKLAGDADDAQRVGLSLSMLGKAHLLRRETVEARAAFSEALQVFRSHNWTTLVPWAETYLAELEFIEGHVDLAAELYEHAFTLASEIQDPCFRLGGRARRSRK